MGTISCKKCNKVKNVSDFKKNNKLKSGYEGSCKDCVKERDTINRQKKINAEKEAVFFKDCKKCLIEKDICEFTVNLSKKDGYEIYCKNCVKIISRKNRESLKIIPDCKLCNKCNEIKDSSEFNKTNSSIDNLAYSCKKCLSILNKDKYKENREISLQYMANKRRLQKESNPEELRDKDRKRRENSRDYRKRYSKNYSKERRLKDPIFKLSGNLRTRIKKSFLKTKHNKKSKTKDIIGCSWEEFKEHIESQFENWMTWENYGDCEENEYKCTWHLDHIIPVSLAETEEDVYLLNHWSNFQPLCGKRNQEKNMFMTDVYNIIINIGLIENKLKYFGTNN